MSDTIDVSLEELRLSVSKAKLFKDCKKRYKFRYIEKVPSKDWEHLIFGSLVHKALEDFHLYYINNSFSSQPFHITMKMALKSALKDFKNKFTNEMKLEAWNLLGIYLKLISNNFPNIISCEEDFNITFDNNIILRGFIDRVQIDPDGVIHVCDYKTSKSDKYLKGDSFQLLVYAYVMLLKNESLTKVRGSYIMVRDNFNMVGEDIDKPFEFERDEILGIKELFQNYAVDIRQETEYVANPTVLCNWCDYVDQCPEGKKMLFNKPFHGELAW